MGWTQMAPVATLLAGARQFGYRPCVRGGTLEDARVRPRAIMNDLIRATLARPRFR
jgi:hypothetical protein